MWLYRQCVKWIESGNAPDWVTRAGIRSLCSKQATKVARMPHDADDSVLEEFRKMCLQAPIAVVPERANEQHYEVPAVFFDTVLGSRRKYSCCYWPDSVHDLDAAEEAALEVTAERAEIANGMRILDLGCGWGSFSLWVAERFPNSRIIAVSNSSSQKEFIQKQAVKHALNNIEVITADMNSFSPTENFDRVVSIEMFEHMRNHQQLLSRIANWLDDSGKLFIHVFCHKRQPYLYPDSDPDDWMGYYFFAGGMMPSESLLPSYQDHLRLDGQWTWNGRHYEKTCNAWLKKMDQNVPLVMQTMRETYGEEDANLWFVRWRLFFMACAELFAYNDGNEWYVTHYRFAK